jgi:protoheme IX farnesyltransferase
MLTVVEPTGRRAGWQAVLAALALVPVSLLAVLQNPSLGSTLFILAATLLGLGQLAVAAAFWQQATDARARLLLRMSLVYLPTVLAMLMLVPWL